MFNLHVIQARYGDCLLLEYGDPDPRYILVDGGPARNYKNALKPALESLMKDSNALEAIMISHIDNDHILGVLDLLAELKYQRDDPDSTPFIDVGQLWFNAFKDTIDTGDLEKRMNQINTVAGVNGLRMHEMSIAVQGVKQGHQVVTLSRILGIKINPDAENNAYIASSRAQVFPVSDLDIRVVGPTMRNLERLQEKWEEWIKANEQKIREGRYTKDFAAMQDRSIPNLSSLVLLIEHQGKSVLLTGDCRGDHLQEGLIETGLSGDGRIHVNVFKVPHHGSRRNVTRKFFEEVTGDTYVISADGHHNNPDYETLVWIVETAKEAGRKIELIFTNHTGGTDDLIKNYPAEEWNYTARFLKEGDVSMVV